jgi:hypothetical protein
MHHKLCGRALVAGVALAMAMGASTAQAACTSPGAPPPNEVGPIPTQPAQPIPMACHQLSPPTSCKAIEDKWTAYNNAVAARHQALTNYLRAIQAWGAAAQAYETCEVNAITIKN